MDFLTALSEFSVPVPVSAGLSEQELLLVPTAECTTWTGEIILQNSHMLAREECSILSLTSMILLFYLQLHKQVSILSLLPSVCPLQQPFVWQSANKGDVLYHSSCNHSTGLGPN